MKFILIIQFLFISISTPLFAGINDLNYGNVIISKIISVYDGDTFRCNIEGFPAIIGENIGIRILGIDTPEMKDKRPHIKVLSIKAKEYTKKRLIEGSIIELKNIKRGKYFRIVAEVWIDGKSLGDELIENCLAKPYNGGKKIKWK